MNYQPMSREEKKKRNRELEQKARKRLEDRGQPFFGAAEKDVLQTRLQVQQLVATNNENVKHIKELIAHSKDQQERIKELNYMLRSTIDLCVTKGVFTKDELNAHIKKHQLCDMQLVEVAKEIGKNDILTIKFVLKCGDKVVDDKTAQAMRYDMGTKGLPCENEFLGMRKGERKVIENIVFGSNFKFAEYANKPLTMDVTICGIHEKQKSQKDKK